MILEYKPSGVLISTFMNELKSVYSDNKIAYAGRLDPMARGLIPILFDEECNMMDKSNNMNKVYEVKLIVGYQTDTDDTLGIIENINILSSNILSSDILEQNNITFEQKYHYYSTKAINQRSKGIYVDNYHTVTLHNSSIISRGTYSSSFLIDDIIKNINRIDKNKDFRQEETIKQWKEIGMNTDSFQYINIKLDVSSGFFVRQFVRDLSDKYKINLMCYDIHRKHLY